MYCSFFSSSSSCSFKNIARHFGRSVGLQNPLQSHKLFCLHFFRFSLQLIMIIMCIYNAVSLIINYQLTLLFFSFSVCNLDNFWRWPGFISEKKNWILDKKNSLTWNFQPMNFGLADFEKNDHRKCCLKMLTFYLKVTWKLKSLLPFSLLINSECTRFIDWLHNFYFYFLGFFFRVNFVSSYFSLTFYFFLISFTFSIISFVTYSTISLVL